MAPERETGDGVLEETRQKTKQPTLYKVLLLNDDYTTMEFVIQILEGIFHKTPSEAYRIMMQVHTEGRGICGAYNYDVAETKVATTQELAQKAGFPLQATLEEE